jgi:5-formyltetrahydrofolate cyclo-ligase
MPSSPSNLQRSRRELRHKVLARRNAVPALVARHAAESAGRHLAASAPFRAAEHVAGYVALAGELDPAPLLHTALGTGKAVYLPCVLHAQRMEFVRWQASDPLQPNRFGILEPTPDPTRMLAPEVLDLVLVPLLGFDAHGNRLGFGGGYYDRTFAFKHDGSACPLLCGYAYAWQETAALKAADWDVRLDAVVTERGMTVFDPHRDSR